MKFGKNKQSDEIKAINKLNQPHKGPKNIDIGENVIIDLKDVKKIFVNENIAYKVLKNIDLQIQNGEFIVILGPSGSGKTTLMNIISGLERATEGVVNVLGNNLINFNNTELTTFRRENIGYIFQQYGLLPNLTVKDNILLGEYLQKKNKKHYEKEYNKKFKKLTGVDDETMNKITKLREEYKDKLETYSTNNEYFNIKNIMQLLQINELDKKYPSQLSGGQQQRVSIARTLIKRPKILFADEPTGAVDTEMSKIIMKSLCDINQTFNTAIIIVTHNPAIAHLADRVIHFADGTIHSIVANKRKLTVDEVKWE